MNGSGLPVYKGYASQYGHGLGNVLGGLVRSAIPLVAPLVKSAGKELLLKGAKTVQRKLRSTKKTKRPNAKMPPGKTVRTRKRSAPRDIFR